MEHPTPTWRRRGVLQIAGWLAACATALPALATSPVLMPQRIKMPPPLDWRPPIITVQGNAQPIQLRAVTIDTDVFGRQAQSRIELRLFNPNPRVLEGELQFPLLEGQVVTGFALDVNGRLRDAVPVAKARGQEIFEDIRRRRVDPGLLEATAGNQYKLRVYPIPGGGERRVQLTISETLPQLQGRAIVRVPLVFSQAVGQLQLQVRASGLRQQDIELLQAPAEASLQPEFDGMVLRLQRTAWTAPQGPAGWLQMAVRTSAAPQVMVGETAGRPYFAGQLAMKDELVRRTEPKHIALVWDASGSAAGSQARVLPLLDAYFKSLRQPLQVSLLVVRNRVEAAWRFTVTGGRWDELLAALRAEPFDGSSNFDQLPIPADADATLLVSDGLMTDGKRAIGYASTAPVFAISGAPATDTPRLTRLAERTGGAMIDVSLLPTEQALRAMQFYGWRVDHVSSLGAERLVAPSLRIREGRIAVAGELTDTQTRVDVHMVHPDGRKRVIAFNVNARQARAGKWPGQQWAQWRSAELAENPAVHRAELEQIAATHGLVGPNSSLIVLEQAFDNARYDLPAPPELADEVARLRQNQSTQLAQQKQAHIANMVRQFDERQQWWERDWPKEPRKDARKENKDEAQQLSRGPAAVGGMARDQARERRAEPAFADKWNAPPTPSVAAPSAAPMAPPAPARQMAESAVAKSASSDSLARAPSAPAQSTIALQPWTADAPYLRRLADAPADRLYATYIDERSRHTSSSAFFIDAASLFFERGQNELALRILSNLAEMNLENRQLLRLYAYRLVQARRDELAVPVFERITELAPNEPQSWRDLGLSLAQTGQQQRAVNALWEVVSRPWHGRFAGINMIALAELNAIAAQAQADGPALDMSRVDARLRRNMPLGLRVVMAWDTDDTDIDLWVTDPNGELANYGNRRTFQGGAVSPDATGGYGPEEYAIRHPKPGKYVVQAQFYGHNQQVLSGGTTVMVRVSTGFGTAAAKDEWLTLRLTQGRETVRVGEVVVKP
ncbi:VIT domain-containing protein [Caenimonas koreensis]|nr:VIT domain-containing protein [Caenimonas koreensis]